MEPLFIHKYISYLHNNMHRMKRICFGVFIFILPFLLSCEKSLDLYPKTTYSEATFFASPENFKLFANQFYLKLPYIGLSDDRDQYSDIVVQWSLNTVSNGSYFPTPTSAVWDDSYATIRNTTYLIQKGDEISPDFGDVSTYIGEAKFFRAFSYFNLFRDFGGVPIIDKVLDLNDNDLLYGPRNSRDEVINYIINDLDDAIDKLPVESAISENNKGRVSKGAAYALKARVALFEGTWKKFRGIDGYNELLDEAIDASEQVINSGEYEIFNRRDVLGDECYRYFFILDRVQSNIANLTKTDQKEYILVNRFDNNVRIQPLISVNWTPSPTKKIADMFLCTDGLPINQSPLFQGKQTVASEYENRDLRMKNIFFVPGTQCWEAQPPDQSRNWDNPLFGGWILKVLFGSYTRTGYLGSKFNPQVLHSSIDLPVIRYAEVLLVNAEASFERNGSITDGVLDLTINKLRGRAGIAKLSNDFVTTNGLDIRTEIRRERTIELYMESQRFDDLRRWKTAEIEMPQALKGVLWTGTQYETDPQWSSVVFPLDPGGSIIIEDASQRSFEEKHYLFSLPTRQLLLNTQLEQNPGW